MHEASHIGESEYVILTHQLTRTFGSLTAVNNISLEVRRGDVFGFLGPNGSGKTTTIRMLLGLIRPTSGSITIFGMNNATHLPTILPRLGAIVETPVFYPYLSGIDNLRTIAAASGMRIGRVNQQRIDEVLEMVDLSRQAKDASCPAIHPRRNAHLAGTSLHRHLYGNARALQGREHRGANHLDLHG
jgi:ABC-2 type transport system ATP-binding protein